MAWIILAVLAAMMIGGVLVYFVLKPRLHTVHVLDEATIRENEQLEDKNAELQSRYELLRAQKEDLLASMYETQAQFDFLRQQADRSAQEFYDQSLALAQEKFAQAIEIERLNYLEAVEEFQYELERTMQEGAAAYVADMTETNLKCKELEQRFDVLLKNTNTAIAAAKRAEEIKQEANYYKIQLSDIDKEEIQMLKNIVPYLRDKEPLNKVIWKVYYEKPATDMIGRVVGSGVKTGIYKITNLTNQMCYVGQAVNIADRWKQHIKRGLGAETPTRNKLYPAMITFGVENFSFEVIEECSRDQLDEREDYWQEYFKAKEFGYSIK